MQWQKASRGHAALMWHDFFMASTGQIDLLRSLGIGLGGSLKGLCVYYEIDPARFVMGPGVDVTFLNAGDAGTRGDALAKCPAGILIDDIVPTRGEPIAGRWVRVAIFGQVEAISGSGVNEENLVSMWSVNNNAGNVGFNVPSLHSSSPQFPRRLTGTVVLTGNPATLNLAGTPGLTWSQPPGYDPKTVFSDQPPGQYAYIGTIYNELATTPPTLPHPDLGVGGGSMRRGFARCMGSPLGRY